MSQPKRYVATYDDGFVTNEYREQCETDKLEGNLLWVKESDYAALAAENERLRKAGDDVVRNIEVASQGLFCAIRRWAAAKEGRDAK